MNQNNHPEADEARSIAIVKLMSNSQAMFYASVCLSLKQIWSDKNKTAWTNGKTIGICPEFFMSIKPQEQIGLMLHETLHVAFFHMFRGHEFDHDIFNMACDYVINQIIVDARFNLPPGALIDQKYVGWSAEQVARDLTDNAQEIPQDIMLDLMPPEEGADQIEADINDILIQASIKTAELDPDMKSIHPEIRRHINLLRNPPVPWFILLSRYFSSFKKTGINWGRPNRRFYPAVYMPIKKAMVLGDLQVYVDASGSVSDQEFDVILSEVWSIFKMLKPNAIHLTTFNRKLGPTVTLKTKKSFETLNILGKGGTRIGPVFQDIQEKKPMVSLIFTDGEFGMPEELPKTPLIWCIINTPDFEAPVGKVIHLEV